MAKQSEPSSSITAAATAAALALATATAKTAEELAKAKVAADVTAAVLAADIGYIKLDVAEIKTAVKSLSDRDGQYVLKDDFAFWRNLLVGGLLVTIFIGVVMNLIKN